MDLKFSNVITVWFILALHSGHCTDRNRRADRIAKLFMTKEAVYSPGSSAKTILGPGVEVKDYDEAEFRLMNGGPVYTTEQLDSDFMDSTCWINPAHSFMNADIKWRVLSGRMDTSRTTALFRTSQVPAEESLIAFSSTRQPAVSAAYFESCSISCVMKPVKVKLKYWLSQGVVLEVCYRNTFFDEGGPLGCQRVHASKQPGPATVYLTINETYTAIIIKASNFVNPGGSVAIIDDLSVDYSLCTSTLRPSDVTTAFYTTRKSIALPAPRSRVPVSVSGTSSTIVTCQNAVCPFDTNLCAYAHYTIASVGGVSAGGAQFAVTRGRFRNQLTGITNGPSGKAYAAVYLARQETVGLQSGPIDLPNDKVLRLVLIEPAHGLVTKVCLNTPNTCPFRTSGVLRRDSRSWRVVNVTLPKYTKKFWIIAENTGLNEGAVGLSNIELLDLPANGDASLATHNVCLNLAVRRGSFVFAKQLRQRSRIQK